MENNTSKNIFAKYPALKAVGGVALVAVLFLGVQSLRDSGRLGGNQSDASCYGYNCQPIVSLGGRVVSDGYNPPGFSYGTLTLNKISPIELTWSGANVDRCQADWTKFAGTYMPPTVYGKVSQNQSFDVTCFKGNKRVNATLKVKIVRTGY